MAFLSASEKQQIEQAIAAVEQQSSGELVAVIAHAADDYLYVSLLWAALTALLVPGLIAFSGVDVLFGWQYGIQIAVFLLLAVILRWRPLLKFIVPRALQYRRAHRLAVEQFLSHNLHHTRERAGVLLFVSVAEHYVEIIADEGINRKVEQQQWDRIVEGFVSSVRSGQVASGFLMAVATCGELLSRHFPAGDNDNNELPDHLIEI